jgi:hypothetical protein
MQEQMYSKLEDRASEGESDHIRRLEARARVRDVINEMRSSGEAYTLSDEEVQMIETFRRFKLRMRKPSEVFSFQTRRPEGVQIVEGTDILHPLRKQEKE